MHVQLQVARLSPTHLRALPHQALNMTNMTPTFAMRRRCLLHSVRSPAPLLYLSYLSAFLVLVVAKSTCQLLTKLVAIDDGGIRTLALKEH